MTVHKTATIYDGAKIADSAEIGPHAVIGPHVTIGAGTKIGPNVVIDGHTTIGDNCHFFAGASVGLEPQDLRYKGEPTGVIIGNNVMLREYVTIHRSTNTEKPTRIGNDCFLMCYAHVAHDCTIGNGVIMANATTLAGHVTVGDFTVLSGMCVIHQFSRVGRMVMMGGMTGTRLDLPPFTMCDGRPAAVRGINVIGLRRNKISSNVRNAIRQTYKLIYRSDLNVSQALERIGEEIEAFPEIQEICDFYRASKRGVVSMLGDMSAGGRENGTLEEVPVEAI